MEALIIVLLIAILLVNMLIVVILKKPEIIMDVEPDSDTIMTPNGKVFTKSGKRSPVYNDDESLWLREQEK